MTQLTNDSGKLDSSEQIQLPNIKTLLTQNLTERLDGLGPNIKVRVFYILILIQHVLMKRFYIDN